MSARSTPSKGSERAIIARVWHGVTPAVRECRATPGNRGVQVLRRAAGGEAHFLFISLWDSMDAIRAFAGTDVERARYYPEDRNYLLDLEPTVTHYEVLEG